MNIMALFNQIITMVILSLLGFILYRKSLLSDTTINELTILLLKGVTPLIVFTNLLNMGSEITIGLFFKLFLVSSIAVFFAHSLAIIFQAKDPTMNYAITFTNSGFLGIPLVTSFFGPKYLIYLIPFLISQNILMWTLGVKIMSGKKSKSLKYILLNNIVIVTLFGIIFNQFGFRLPFFVEQAASYLTVLNTPLAMIILGVYVNNFSKDTIKDYKNVLLTSLLRLIVSPFLMILIFKYFNILGVSKEALLVISVLSSCPSATNAVMFSQLFGNDSVKAAAYVSVTTMLSMFTIPLIAYVAMLLI